MKTPKQKKKVVKAVCQCPLLGKVESEREYQYTKEEKAGMNHAPGKCKGTYHMRKYKRNGKELNLCSCCYIFGDIEL